MLQQTMVHYHILQAKTFEGLSKHTHKFQVWQQPKYFIHIITLLI